MVVTPTEALDRIVYLLDRDLAPPYKVRAFLRARDVVAGLSPPELEALVASGRIGDLPGIGRTTAAVITEAQRGEIPAYLARLEQQPGIELSPGGSQIRAALRGDCHVHSTWSDGGASIEAMARAARDLGHDYMVITDHSARATYARGLGPERLRRQIAEVQDLNQRLAPFRVLTGMEVDILEDGTLDLDGDLLGELDVVVGSVHSKLRLGRRAMTERLVAALANPHTDILGHLTGRKVMGRLRPQSEMDAEVVFAAAQRFDKAIEINCRPERRDPPSDLLELALEWGCKLAIDSDAHAPGQLEWVAYGCEKASGLGVGADQIVNAWSPEQLVAWTRR